MKQDRKLLTQTEIARKLSVSKGNLSKWIKKENVSPVAEEGNKKLFDETLINKYKELEFNSFLKNIPVTKNEQSNLNYIEVKGKINLNEY